MWVFGRNLERFKFHEFKANLNFSTGQNVQNALLIFKVTYHVLHVPLIPSFFIKLPTVWRGDVRGAVSWAAAGSLHLLLSCL
jgi:hypothetical protein